jgi:two-component system, OmpR family, phosphate regulon sensor histidine kinase PhoR
MMFDGRFRHRARLVLVFAALLEAALVLPFVFFYSSRPEIPAALAVLAAVLAAVAGGPWPGMVAAALGLALVAAFAADDALAVLAIPPGIAVAALAGIVSDRLRRADTQRQRAASGLDAVRETVSDAVVGLDLDGTIVGWSTGAARLYGYSSDAAVGRPFSMLLPDDSTLPARDEHVDYGDVVHRRADGSDVVVSLTVVPVADAAGEVVAAYAVAADVEQRAQMQEKLREAESNHRALVEHLPLVTYVREAGSQGSLLFVSPQVDSLLGYSADELLAEPKLFAELLAQGRECRMSTRDGRLVWLRNEAVTVRDARGRPLYQQGYLLDISERKDFDVERESLRATESAALARVDRGRLRLDALAEAGELLGSSLEYATTLKSVAELVVRHFADWCIFHVLDEEKDELEPIVVVHAEPLGSRGAPDWRQSPAAQRVVQTRSPEVVPAIGSPRSNGQGDGEDVSYICAPLLVRRRAVGTVTFVSTTTGDTYDAEDVRFARDVAARAAVAIDVSRLHREVEDRADAQRVLAHVADGVFLLDRAGVIRLWNPAAEAITGLVASTVVGRSVTDVLPGWETLAERIRVSTVPDPARSETVPFETGRGERWLSISGVEFFGGTVYAFRDITEERRLDELKSEFVATASHELRTPLAAVYGAAQTLRRHDFALDEGGRERFISIIAEESERLSRIVNEILLANQLDSGRLDLVTEPFDAAELVARVVEASRAHLPPGVTLRVRMPDSLPPVDADREKVRQVLVNLIENAVKYSPDGGRIEVGLAPRGMAVRFFIKDKGLGIPAEEQERIFDKFYRLDPAMARGVGGTGLGLYICSELVTRMGGRIWVESQEGEGSTFSFELPSEAATPTRPAAADARVAQNGPTLHSSTPAARS